MSGSSQTWPFEQIPAMSGYPPKGSEYDSYWSHRNAGRPQVRFAFLVPPSRCEQLLVRAFGFLGEIPQAVRRDFSRPDPETLPDGRGSGWFLASAVASSSQFHVRIFDADQIQDCHARIIVR